MSVQNLADPVAREDNKRPWIRTNQEPTATQIFRRKWSWIGHTSESLTSLDITRQGMTWNPQGKKKN